MLYRVRSAPACAPLRPYVRAYVQREIDAGFGTVCEAVPARLDQLLEFEFGTRPELQHLDGRREVIARICVSGLEARCRLNICLPTPINSFGVFFEPQGLRQLFSVPTPEMLSIWYEGDQLLGREVRELAEQLGETERFEERVRLAERYLLKRAGQVRDVGTVGRSVAYLVRRPGAVRVSDLASMSAMSIRQYERLFRKEIGIAPKLFARITRFQNALNAKLLEGGRSWLDIAHYFGYHDQMHMVRDFRTLGGDTPSGVVAKMGEMWPEALAGWRIEEEFYEEGW